MLFVFANLLGDVTLVHNINLFGPLGMVVFLAVITYLIVRYQVLHVRIIATQALVGALIVLIFAALFVRTIDNVRYVLGGTLILIVLLGISLVRSVKREIEQREHIEKLAGELQETNKRQETLMHFIGHEVKGFLTKDSNAFAALADGDFGVLPEQAKQLAEHALTQSREGAASVTNILTASNQKKGTVSYTKAPLDLKIILSEAVESAKSLATEKGLALSLTVDDKVENYVVNGDREKLKENVLRNIIENSIHYTPSGSIGVNLGKSDSRFIVSIKDTGIGITDEDKKLLFTEGGHGKDSQRINVHSTGYGLFIAKNIVEAHGGSIRAESEGAGKGSTFVVELPVN